MLMKKLHTIALLLTIVGVSLSPITDTVAAQSPSPSKPNEQIKRTLPYRGIIGTVDIKKKTFTLKNKSNTETRLFQIDTKTRFESGKRPKTIDNLKPNLAVRGSCIKTGERQFVARLVRWEIENSGKPTKSQPANSDQKSDKKAPK
jgi:hypothetical protein